MFLFCIKRFQNAFYANVLDQLGDRLGIASSTSVIEVSNVGDLLESLSIQEVENYEQIYIFLRQFLVASRPYSNILGPTSSQILNRLNISIV